MPDNAPFAARIRELRTRQGLSQRAVARSVGWSPAVWQGYEAGRHHPRAEQSAKIARALNVPIAALYAPTGWHAIAEVLIPTATLEQLHAQGEPHARTIATQYAEALIPALLAASAQHHAPPPTPVAGKREPRMLPPRSRSSVAALTVS